MPRIHPGRSENRHNPHYLLSQAVFSHQARWKKRIILPMGWYVFSSSCLAHPIRAVEPSKKRQLWLRQRRIGFSHDSTPPNSRYPQTEQVEISPEPVPVPQSDCKSVQQPRLWEGLEVHFDDVGGRDDVVWDSFFIPNRVCAFSFTGH
jgi:hypothetical protein